MMGRQTWLVRVKGFSPGTPGMTILPMPSIPRIDLLGTQDEHKKHVIYDAGHFRFPRNQLVSEVSDWLDTYLGDPR